MKIESSLQQLSKLVKGHTSLDQSFVVKNLSSLETAGPDDIAVVLDRGTASPFSEVEKKKIENCKAGVILARDAVIPGKPYVLVDDPLHAFVQLTQFARQKEDETERGSISPQADIASGAYLGEGVTVGAFAVVEKGARVGDYVHIGAHCFVGAGATVGDSTTLHPHVTISADCHVGAHTILHSGVIVGADGFGYQATEKGMRKIPQVGSVHIGNHVELGAGCCIDRATFDATVIGDGCKLDNLVHIAHNVSVGAATAILAQTGIAGGAKIGSGCQIGGQVAIKDHVSIGDRARIVSKSAVMKDVEAGATVCGTPAIEFRKWKRNLATTNALLEQVQNRGKGKDELPFFARTFGAAWRAITSFVRFPKK